MKSLIKISLSIVFVCMMFAVSAQTIPQPKGQAWPVSKDVQRYSNKSLSDPAGVEVKSVGTPDHVYSKMNRKKSVTASTGNVASTGTPAWIISKPVQMKRK
jgi:hypothetical protein